MLFVEYPKCTTCQKAKKWLEAQGVEFQSRHILEENPTREELEAALSETGVQAEPTQAWKDLNLPDASIRLGNLPGWEWNR